MSPDPAHVASFESVSVTFPDGTRALEEVDLHVGAGEFVSIIGPSGCGKSTLLRVAAGLQAHDSGTCSVDRKDIGFVFQDPNLLPWRTVTGNVSLPAELHGIDARERDSSVAAAVDLVGLSDFADHYPSQLSGGMRMRTSLARSLVLSPGLFLFDEPFGALDEMTRERLNDEIRDLYVRRQFTALFVTHSVAEAVYMSSRVVVMSARPGRITADIPVDLPLERPHDVRYTPQFADTCGRLSRALREAAA